VPSHCTYVVRGIFAVVRRIILCPLSALRRFGHSEALYRGSHRLYKLTLRQIKQAHRVVQRRGEYLRSLTHTQGPRQCCWRSRGRRGAPIDHVDRASASLAQEFNWCMEIALPTGDTQNGFSRLARDSEFLLVYNLDSFGPFGRDTTPWSVPFPQLDNIQLTDLQVFLILNLNGESFLFYPTACAWMESDRSRQMRGTRCGLFVNRLF
jgi:hypothetical protein